VAIVKHLLGDHYPSAVPKLGLKATERFRSSLLNGLCEPMSESVGLYCNTVSPLLSMLYELAEGEAVGGLWRYAKEFGPSGIAVYDAILCIEQCNPVAGEW